MNGPSVTVTRNRKRKLTKVPLHGPTKVRVGFPRSKTKGAVIERAIYNEFGTRRIPERPFFRNAMRNNRNKYRDYLARVGKGLIRGNMTPTAALTSLGVVAVGDIQHEITTLMTPPNAPSTIKRKKSSKPLIDTGEMRQAVTFELVR